MDFSNSTIFKSIAHEVGNKFRDEGIGYSDTDIDIQDNDTQILFTRYLLSSFKEDEFYNFFHPTDLLMNEVYVYVSNIFKNPSDFIEQSKSIALHLYNESTHPKVNKGELYIVFFKECRIEDEVVDAIGIFKSETKDSYLKAQKHKDNFVLVSDRGVNVDKLDKGCIIFNTERKNGFKVTLVNSSRSDDAQYWKERFLQLTASNDSYHSTKNYLSLTKAFVTKELANDIEINNAEKADLLNRSVAYFKNNSQFSEKEFASEVFSNPQIADSFKQFKNEYKQQRAVDLADDFQISSQVVKKQAKILKSVIKLDKNFHIYIHGQPELIEKGFDEVSGKYFYKVFFDNES
ncbi:nucleoid associated protein NdpA [Chryseobacterium sp. 52]|uniref:nucleoid-associated protein n=1 Tax=Chryseobacterium sp. 52 TaxID=2035213 RepID=UPI000C1A2DC8|nr:nucleoid-associated protein [Chryseobacterium sp. 52]PIF45324.1 nucleoid associated protein NdpA [Chryseobacterium sp. 52]